MTRIALFMLAVSLFAISCKKDENKSTVNGGSFTLDGKVYTADYAYWNISDGLKITNISVAPDYIENFVQIFVDTLNYPKYDFLSRNNGAYDAKKNFSSAVVRYNVTNVAGAGTEITGVTAGTVNVSHSGDKYTINYTITVGGKVITGNFNGTLYHSAPGN